MDEAVVLVVFLSMACLMVAAVLPIVAIVLAARAGGRVRKLSEEFADLERRLLESGAVAVGPTQASVGTRAGAVPLRTWDGPAPPPSAAAREVAPAPPGASDAPPPPATAARDVAPAPPAAAEAPPRSGAVERSGPEAAAQATAPVPASPATPPVEAEPAPGPLAEPRLDPTPPSPVGAGPARAPTPAGPSWERILGVGGAAVAGGVVLALAGILLFKYSIERGLITPSMRVLMGMVGGCACIAVAQARRLRPYAVTAHALAGAGLAALYASTWAARALYSLVAWQVALLLMVLVSSACVALSVRHGSRVIALLGLVGGLCTPLAVNTGKPPAPGLFAYLLLLDIAFLVLARRQRWAGLVPLALLGTFGWQVIWVAVGMEPGQLLLALAILAVFALLFALAKTGLPREGRLVWDLSAGAALLLPFTFALWFATASRFGPHLWPVGGLLLLLSVCAASIGAREGGRVLVVGVVLATLPILLAWTVARPLDGMRIVEVGAVAFLLAAVQQAFAEWETRRGVPSPLRLAPAVIATLGGGAIVLLAEVLAPSTTAPWHALACVAALAMLALRQGALPETAPIQLPAALGIAIGLSVPVLRDPLGEGFPSFTAWLAAVGAALVGLQAWAVALAPIQSRRIAEHCAALAPAVLCLALLVSPSLEELPPTAVLGAVLVLGALIALAATRLDAGVWYIAAALLPLLVHARWVAVTKALGARPDLALWGLLLGLLGVAAAAGWPVLAAPAFRRTRSAWYGAALAGPAWFFAGRRLFEARFGEGAVGLLPVALGAICVVALAGARRALPGRDPVGVSAAAWLGATGLAFVTAAVPLQLRNEWITIGWALEGVAVLVLWVRLDHAGLKWFAALLFAAVGVRLLLNPYVLGYGPRGSWRIVNWIAWTYLVPAAAMLGAARILRKEEGRRARRLELWLYPHGRPVLAPVLTLLSLVVVFVWINLAVLDWFSEGDRLVLDLARRPARDLALSICWALYALSLLGVGVASRSRGFRWGSLVLLIVTIGKAFLYDLGELEDLYRVGSLVGLAVSLILVSLVYQRFVFRRGVPEAAPGGPVPAAGPGSGGSDPAQEGRT